MSKDGRSLMTSGPQTNVLHTSTRALAELLQKDGDDLHEKICTKKICTRFLDYSTKFIENCFISL